MSPSFRFTLNSEELTIGDEAVTPFELGKYDLGWPDVRAVSEDRTGMNGAKDLTEHFGARVVTMEVTCVDATPTEMVQLARFSNPSQRPTMHVTGSPNMPEAFATVRPAPVARGINPSDHAAQIQRQIMQWVVPAGVFRAVESQRFQLWPSSAIEVGGRTYDRIGDREYPPVGFVGAVDVVNYGSATADPMIVIYGPITAPIVSDVSTGREYSFPTLTLAAGAHLQIDVANRTVRFNSDPADSRLKFKARGPWWGIEPWTQQLQLDGTGTTAQTNAVVTFADTYL